MDALPKRTSLSLKLLLLAWILLSANSARADLDSAAFTADLNQLLLEGDALLASMTLTALTPFTMAGQTETLAAQADSYLADVAGVYDALQAGESMSLSDEMLLSLEALSALAASLAPEAMRLSAAMASLAAVTATQTLDASLAAMLQLSADIGVMADRIGEMADRILVMADDIGIMADRILATQVIQSGNLALVVNAVLLSQQNLITLAANYSL